MKQALIIGGIVLIIIFIFGAAVFIEIEKDRAYIDGFCTEKIGVYNLTYEDAGSFKGCTVLCFQDVWKFVSDCGLNTLG